LPSLPAAACQASASFRLSRERLGSELRLSCGRAVGKAAAAFIFGRLASRCRPELQLRSIGFAAEVKGLLNSGRMTEEYLLKALDTAESYQISASVESDNPCCQITGRRRSTRPAQQEWEKGQFSGDFCNYRVM
jgi:hypothetical protein